MANIPLSARAIMPISFLGLQELAGLITAELNLDVPPGDIAPEAPLYGEGLGLDSIDILELALVVSRRYGVRLRSDHEDNTVIFGSLANLARFIAQNRTK
ncbi:MAG: phosphopantetheine-binding protein [Proteobacteria bacterium]|nr:phosphopantetheine-binding protein [Pseudomonadota bacterium]